MRPKTLNLNITKAKQQWEEEIERLNSKYNLDFYSDSELDSESDEGEHTAMNMVLKHLFGKCKNEIFKLKFAITSFSKTNLPIEF